MLQQQSSSPPAVARQWENDQARNVDRAIALGRARFANLCREGILGGSQTGEPVDRDDVAKALAFLSQCRKTRVPTGRSFDLRRAIGDVQLGAVIAAAVALGFDVRSWYGVMGYAPHAVINVSRSDVKRMAVAES